jgi:polysaccharide export outer membrane protein
LKKLLFTRIFRLSAIAAVILLIALNGCNTTVPTGEVKRTPDGELVRLKQTEDLPEAEKANLRQNLIREAKDGLTRYRLSPGDSLEVMYHLSLVSETQAYRIGVNDELNLDFFYQPQINRTVVVRPDGKITVPIKGDFSAAGLKPEELASHLAKAFSDILNKPIVTVSVNKYSSKITELQKAITNAPRGQAKVFPIGPDGNVYLPLLKPVKAANRTIDELNDAINNEYRYEFNNLTVSVLIDSLGGSRAFVFGEVFRPGPVLLSKPMTVLQVIAQSGGVMPTGTLKNVKILYWNEKNEPIVRTIDLFKMFSSLSLENDMIVPNNAVIYVPKTTITKMDQWVDQYIKQLFLYQGESASMGFTYILHQPTIVTTTTPSDRRLKTDIKRIGTHPLGIGIYSYKIFGKRQIGVMADEVLKVKPEAVIVGPDGYLRVDYGQL